MNTYGKIVPGQPLVLVTVQTLSIMLQKEIDRALDERDNQVWNFQQAANYLGLSVSKLKQLKGKGEIQCFQPSPGIVRFSKKHCDDWLKSTGKEGDV